MSTCKQTKNNLNTLPGNPFGGNFVRHMLQPPYNHAHHAVVGRLEDGAKGHKEECKVFLSSRYAK